MNTAAVRRLAIPSPDELVERARAMVPAIRALAEETERNRTLLPQIVEQIRASELLRTCRPRMFGGFEYDGEVALKIALTISAACASTGWTVNGAVSNGYSLAHWPIEAQRELWEGDADPFTFACFAPTGTAIPVEGGYRLSGQWSFASGCDLAQWGKLGAMITPPGKEPPYEGAFFLLPEDDYEIVDNWFVCGLAGTGSKDVVVKGAFVPEHRVLRFADTRAGTSAGGRGMERGDGRLGAASQQPGAARLARRECCGTACQPQLGRRRHDVWAARLRPRAEGAILRGGEHGDGYGRLSVRRGAV